MKDPKKQIWKMLIIPIGEIDQDVIKSIASGLAGMFHSEVEKGAAIPTPESAYDSVRDQYHSTTILRVLERIKPKETDWVIGVIDQDLYVPELNFVFGEASISTGSAVISLSRLRQEYYGLRLNQELFLQRALKEAIHELGHTFGLGHCRDPKCIMHFSNSLADTDRKGPGFCSLCARLLATRIAD